MAASLANPDLRRKLKVRMRPDIIVTEQKHGGQTFFIVKDPVSLRYFRFREEELFLLRQLDGKKNLDDVRHEFIQNFRPQRLSVQDLEKFVRQLLQAGIATVDTPQVGQRLYERHKKKQRDKVKQVFLNLMYLKIPVFDPEKILARLLPWTQCLFTLPFFVCAIMFWLSAAGVILINWDMFLAKLPTLEQFFTLQNLFTMWVLVGAVKVVHEFGHGLACKRFGGEVHEMGLMLLVFSPCLYCNVTDSWMLPNKWQRATIGAAGIYVELIIAAAAVWIWWFTEPGLLNTLCLNAVIVCGISTVLFNGNPLMRFDGYYILSDLLEIPNLRERSNKYLGNLASRWVFGKEAVPDPFAPARARWFFATYAVSAYIYRWLVSLGIIVFLYAFLKPYKLEIIGIALAWATVFAMVVVPVYKTQRTLRQRWKEMKVDKMRATIGVSVALALLAMVFFIPLPMRVDLPFVVQPRGATPIYVQAEGILHTLSIKDGAPVAPNAELARLENPELTKELRKLQLEHARQAERRRACDNLNDRAGSAEAISRMKAIDEQLEHLDGEMARMVLRAPAGVSGACFTPPRETHLGSTLPQGTLFCKIGRPDDLEAYMVVEHSDTSLLTPGQRVWVKVSGHLGAIHESSIERISATELADLPPALSSQAGGGNVATVPDEKKAPSKQQQPHERPLMRSYSVMVPLANADGSLVPGVRGTARVEVGYRSLSWRIKRYLQQTFHFRM